MTQQINLIVVDDEEEAREGLKIIIDEHQDYNLMAVAKNGLEAITLINEKKPDLVLLDIQMPEINGFDVLNNINLAYSPFIIFVTAYDQYAIKAFEHHAIDYILKPFTNARLFKALDNAKERVNQLTLNAKLEDLLTDYKKNKTDKESDALINQVDKTQNETPLSRLVVKSFGKIHFVEVGDIIWVQAYDYYIKIYVKDKFYLVRQSLKSMETNLPSSTFCRIHKSNIININHVKELDSRNNGDYQITLSTGVKVNMSRNYKDNLNLIYKKLT